MEKDNVSAVEKMKKMLETYVSDTEKRMLSELEKANLDEKIVEDTYTLRDISQPPKEVLEIWRKYITNMKDLIPKYGLFPKTGQEEREKGNLHKYIEGRFYDDILLPFAKNKKFA
ncbi:MAG: hypothetical protein WC475_05070 [Candidatus Paceibacterota bacterium]